jgi:hypothetical protein
LLLVSRDTGEELACIVVLAEVGDSSCAIEELEVCAIELARDTGSSHPSIGNWTRFGHSYCKPSRPTWLKFEA